MLSRVVYAENPAQAWRIAVLTFIVLVVGCSRSKTPSAPPAPNAAAAAARDAAQRDVNESQVKIDELGATLTKLEVEFATLKGQVKSGEPAAPEASTTKASELESKIASQRTEIDKATKELAERKIKLQKAQKEANSLRNDPDKK
ncbi:MAG TPA: hypothetical protein VGJ26_17280 [Pirellulales bacterium]|jgi:chromosome segregation ATPase